METGYIIYTISPGDTVFAIAASLNIRMNRILYANPGLDVYNLQIGQQIIVPVGEVVPTNVSYTYDILKSNIKSLQTIYPFLKIESMGKSILGKELYVIRLGKGEKQVFYSASIHANEWITSPLLMKFLENFCLSYVTNSSIYGYSSRNIFDTASIYIAPMVNPDGVDLVTGAISSGSPIYESAKLIASNFPNIPFPSGWKANINGVDLNLQFPAGWENAREIKYAQGFIYPAPRDFVGFNPLTEPESFSMYKFTLSHNFRLILAYHTQGKEIYWQFQGYAPEEALIIR